MQQINVVNGPQNASRIILGCMRMPALSVYESADMIRAAAEEGINFFDHATCYGDGEAETRFGDAFPLSSRRPQADADRRYHAKRLLNGPMHCGIIDRWF